MSQNWVDKHAKLCPRCSAPIEKKGGCDHMECMRCYKAFKWVRTSKVLIYINWACAYMILLLTYFFAGC